MGEEIKAIDGLGRCDKAIGAMQGNGDAVDGRLFIRVLYAVAVGIQIDEVAKRPQCGEGDGVAGRVVTRNGVANGASVSGVGDRLGAVGGGTDGDAGAGVGQ